MSNNIVRKSGRSIVDENVLPMAERDNTDRRKRVPIETRTICIFDGWIPIGTDPKFFSRSRETDSEGRARVERKRDRLARVPREKKENGVAVSAALRFIVSRALSPRSALFPSLVKPSGSLVRPITSREIPGFSCFTRRSRFYRLAPISDRGTGGLSVSPSTRGRVGLFASPFSLAS